MSGIFAKIASGEIPSYKIAESDRYFAFLDINPLAKGHTLIIPRQETESENELTEHGPGQGCQGIGQVESVAFGQHGRDPPLGLGQVSCLDLPAGRRDARGDKSVVGALDVSGSHDGFSAGVGLSQ